jgi:hypothetical protein
MLRQWAQKVRNGNVEPVSVVEDFWSQLGQWISNFSIW